MPTPAHSDVPERPEQVPLPDLQSVHSLPGDAENDNSWAHLEDLTVETAEAVDDVVYNDRKGLKPYRIIKPDTEKIGEWKAQIDKLIQTIKDKNILYLCTLMMKNGRRKGNHEALVNMLQYEKMDEQDVILWAIGLFALREKSTWNPIKTRMKLLKGGDIPMESFFTKDGRANCYDIAVFVKTMAAEYGIHGDVVGKWIRHAKFITAQGKVSDPLKGYKRGGLFQSAGMYKRFLEEEGGRID